jgi:WD40 repeat protein
MSEDQVLRWWRPGQRRTRRARQLVDTDELLDPQLWFDAAGDRLQLTAGRGQVSSWNLVDATVRRGKTLGVTDARLLRWSDADLADRLPPYRYAAISPDTGMLALADLEEGALWLWPEQAEGPQRIDGPNHLHNPEWMHGNRLVLLHGLNEVYVVDGDTGEPREKFAMGCDVGHAIPHPADELIVLCGSDRHVHLWVPGESDTRILQGHSAPVLAAAFSPDGRRLATGGSDRTVRLWDTSQWAEVAKLTTEAEVGELCWSADGTRLAAAMTSGAAIVWDTRGSTRER